MASLCNYTHPELQNTTSLVRHGAGILFPYNPEFYERASGLYGPGSICAWHLLFLSVIISWANEVRSHWRHPSMSADLVAFVAYPVFAATDLLVQTIKLIGTEHRAVAIFCLRNPTVTALLDDYRDVGFPQTPLSLAEIPPDILHLGQRLVEITGPLAVSYIFSATFSTLAIASFPVFFSLYSGFPQEPAPTVIFVLVSASAYVSLVLLVFHCSLGDFGLSFNIWLWESLQLYLKGSATIIALFLGGVTLYAVRSFILDVAIRRGWVKVWNTFIELGIILLPGVWILCWHVYFLITLQIRFIPDLGVTTDERDQLAALIAGCMALIYTIYGFIRDGRRQRKLGDKFGLGERLPLIEEEEESQGVPATRRMHGCLGSA